MTRSTISPSPIFISFTLLFITFACATSSLNEIENFKPKGSDGFTVPSHVEEQGEESVKEYLDSVFKNALFGSDSTETVQNKEAYPHSYDIEAESNAQIKDQVDAEPRLIVPKHIEEEGPEAIKKYLDYLFSKALFGTDSTQTGQDGKKREDGDKSVNKASKLRKEEEVVNDDIAVNVNLEIVGDGEYVLKLKRLNPNSNNEDEVERAKHLAQNGAMLLHYGEILQDMGDKLITQSQALLYSVFKMPAPPKFKSDD